MTRAGRLTRERVSEIKNTAHITANADLYERVRELCDSHEIYRGFAQEFINIYANVGDKKLTHDQMEVEFFTLFLKIVGQPPPA